MGAAPERSIGRYRVVGALGAGAMGEVVRARDERLGRDVAIKRVKNVFGVMAATFHARFESEARALAALAHPGVVQVFDLGVDGDEPYLVMELIDGPSLRALLTDGGPMAAADVRAMGIQLARALEAAHARGILHRDVKPANVLRAPGGVWKLADFGVAHVPDSDVTITGQFVGTPAYAAPEALTAGEFSPASDVFALAATLYEAATGRKPRADGSLAQTIARSGDPVTLSALPRELVAALGPALAVDPHARPGAAALAELLAGTSEVRPITPFADTLAARPTATAVLPPAGAAPRPDRRWLAIVGAAAALVVLLALCTGGGSSSTAGRPPLSMTGMATPPE
ncbi:MAG TPA: serine/threonine-protein kinase, partial [Kofleriaceae bacterium]|nr:serine/threonine-protein kinase [Kofleriaceae bacterium]